MAARRQKNYAREKIRKSFVLDCSIVFAWYFADESNSYADAVAASLSKADALVPTHWSLEVANALLTGERSKRSTEAQASTFITTLAALPIKPDSLTAAQACSATIALARIHNLSSYDAAYLELAMRHSLPLATLDKALKRAAKAMGVAIYQPDTR
jgi:predicted nucleic acid-binding protein